jgi:hypothetical protein
MGVGCGLGMPWSYLGDDPTDATAGVDFSGAYDTGSIISTSDLTSLEQPGGILATGGILGPSAPPVTVDQLNTYVQTGQADSSIIGQLSQLVSAAGPAVNTILQQVQLGQLAGSTPVSSLAALRSAITGQSTIGGLVASDPMILVLGAGLLLFLLTRKGKA